MSLNDLTSESPNIEIDVGDSLDDAVGDLHRISREIEYLSGTAVEVVEALDNNEHELHWSEVDAAKMLWEKLDDMVESHKEAVQIVDDVRRELE